MYGLPQWLGVKDSICNAGATDASLVPGSERSPGGENDNPLQPACLGESCGQRSLAGSSPWGQEELGRTKVTEHAHMYIYKYLILGKYFLKLINHAWVKIWYLIMLLVLLTSNIFKSICWHLETQTFNAFCMYLANE